MEENEITYKAHSANVVRNKIKRFLDNSGVQVGQFIDTLGSNRTSYNSFMQQSGPNKGLQCAIYESALGLFSYMEHKNIPFPTKACTAAKPRKKAVDAGSALSTTPLRPASKTSTAIYDINSITLPGEMSDAVKIYDTCDEIRRKISAHLRKVGVTQEAFLRELAAQFHTASGPSQLQIQHLSSFCDKHGPAVGYKSPIFYASYVFFEKERIAANVPKVYHREEMECIWAPRGGFNPDHSGQRGYWCSSGKRPHVDNFGRLTFVDN
jgi:hypothetical protein